MKIHHKIIQRPMQTFFCVTLYCLCLHLKRALHIVLAFMPCFDCFTSSKSACTNNSIKWNKWKHHTSPKRLKMNQNYYFLHAIYFLLQQFVPGYLETKYRSIVLTIPKSPNDFLFIHYFKIRRIGEVGLKAKSESNEVQKKASLDFKAFLWFLDHPCFPCLKCLSFIHTSAATTVWSTESCKFTAAS